MKKTLVQQGPVQVKSGRHSGKVCTVFFAHLALLPSLLEVLSSHSVQGLPRQGPHAKRERESERARQGSGHNLPTLEPPTCTHQPKYPVPGLFVPGASKGPSCRGLAGLAGCRPRGVWDLLCWVVVGVWPVSGRPPASHARYREPLTAVPNQETGRLTFRAQLALEGFLFSGLLAVCLCRTPPRQTGQRHDG
ncbi:hypothetical protein K456DRAFT_1480390 [Colletotrichum gloeosporioides 23]|nr:hypothetical protein K456DRAFT_1480390 [Colletotrichum gloeosporioides 23]